MARDNARFLLSNRNDRALSWNGEPFVSTAGLELLCAAIAVVKGVVVVIEELLLVDAGFDGPLVTNTVAV